EQLHARLLRRAATLAVVARPARRDEVLPGVLPASMLGDDVVEREVAAAAAAVLAALQVAREDLAAGQSRAWMGTPHEVVEADDGGRDVVVARAGDQLVAVLQHL